jgi:hypothetical protein
MTTTATIADGIQFYLAAEFLHDLAQWATNAEGRRQLLDASTRYGRLGKERSTSVPFANGAA